MRELLSPRDAAVPSFLDLMEQLFPPEEREPREEIAATLGKPGSLRSFVVEDDGQVSGLCRGVLVPEVKGGWIVHIGFIPSARGGGRGAKLFREMEAALAAGGPYEGTIVEVERLEDAQESEKQGRQKRLAWFGGMGAIPLASTYIQPPSSSATPPVLLNLLWVPAVGKTGVPLRPEEMIKGFYAGAFGLDEQHPYVLSALGRLSPAEALGA